MYIMKKGERAERLYGLYEEVITDEELIALINGKRLWFSVGGGEYAIVLKRGKENEQR